MNHMNRAAKAEEPNRVGELQAWWSRPLVQWFMQLFWGSGERGHKFCARSWRCTNFRLAKVFSSIISVGVVEKWESGRWKTWKERRRKMRPFGLSEREWKQVKSMMLIFFVINNFIHGSWIEIWIMYKRTYILNSDKLCIIELTFWIGTNYVL